MIKRSINTANLLAVVPLIWLINIYQKTISLDHGPLKSLYPQGFCQFHPTCSEYGKQALRKKGVLGLPLIAWRILRCNPWSKGGIDEVN